MTGSDWSSLVDLLFLAVTAGIAWHAVRHRDADGRPDFVRLLFGTIAATYFLLVLMKDVLGIAPF